MEDPKQNNERLLKELAEREERYRSVTETSLDAIITASSDDRVLTFNKGAREMFGHGPEIVGQSITRLIPPHLRHAHRKGLERYLATGQARIMGRAVELSALRADGSVFQIELTLSTWEGMDGAAFGAIIRDASERKRVEVLKEDVARMIRHDLRSPLVGVAGLAKRLAKAENLDSRQRRTAETIAELGQKMLAMIDRSRDFFQLEEGVYHLKPVELDLATLVARAAAQLETMAGNKKVGLAILVEGKALDQAGPCLMAGEEGLLENLFANLVKNAIEASPPGSLVRVGLRSADQGQQWLVDIHNQGTIPEEVRARFFEAYVTAGKEGGTGLGTHNAMLATRAHGGEISFTTSVQDGTHLLVRLPRSQPPQPAI